MASRARVVVVVDDDVGMLKSIARLLAVHGFEVRLFDTAEALINSGEVESAACLLLDIQLGNGMSGIELRRHLTASVSKCPVIFMTAADDKITLSSAVSAGCVACLQKPFEPGLLLDKIAIAISEADAGRSSF